MSFSPAPLCLCAHTSQLLEGSVVRRGFSPAPLCLCAHTARQTGMSWVRRGFSPAPCRHRLVFALLEPSEVPFGAGAARVCVVAFALVSTAASLGVVAGPVLATLFGSQHSSAAVGWRRLLVGGGRSGRGVAVAACCTGAPFAATRCTIPKREMTHTARRGGWLLHAERPAPAKSEMKNERL